MNQAPIPSQSPDNSPDMSSEITQPVDSPSTLDSTGSTELPAIGKVIGAAREAERVQNAEYIEVREPDISPNEASIESPKQSVHPEVVRFNNEINTCSVELPDSVVGGDFFFKNRIIHLDLWGEIIQGESPFEGADDSALEMLDGRQIDEEKARTAIDEAPDVNNKFGDVLDEVYASRDKEGLPIKILNGETCENLSDSHPILQSIKNNDGLNALGYKLIKEPSDEQIALWGHKLVRFLIHHEDNHPHVKRGINTVYTLPKITPDGIIASPHSIPLLSDGFNNLKIDDRGNFQDRGTVFEEGFAQLKALMAVNDFDNIHQSEQFGVLPNGDLEFVEGNNVDK